MHLMKDASFPTSEPIPVHSRPLWLYGCEWKVPAGVPSPAADHTEERIDLNKQLIRIRWQPTSSGSRVTR